MSDSRDDFYVGYMPEAPAGLGRWLRRTVLACVAIALGTGLLLAKGQGRSGPSVYEFEPSKVEGILRMAPHPHLVTLPQIPNRRGMMRAVFPSVFLLTVFGKVGADEALAEHDGYLVSLSGAVIHRNGRSMLEVDPSSVERLREERFEDISPRLLSEDATFEGEIVDAKCYLGVMKPGHGKIHKSCAIRCISGGVPPILVVEDGEFLLLVDSDGHPVGSRVLDFIAEPVRIQGRYERIGDLGVLRIDPARIERLSAQD